MSVTKVTAAVLESGTKGADIASSSTIVIGKDGSYFDITGTTGIGTMTVDAGRLFTLQFDGVVILTHSSTLYLSGAANFTTEANDHLTFIAVAANDVRQIGAGLKDGGSPVVATVDTTAIENDIVTLAFYSAVQTNQTGHGLANSWIDQFENSTFIDNLSSVARISPDEYVASVYTSLGDPDYAIGDRTSRITVTTNESLSQGIVANLVDGAFDPDATDAILGTGQGSVTTSEYFQFDFGSGNSIYVTEAKWYANDSATRGVWKWQRSDDAASWSDIGSSFTLGGATPYSTQTELSNNAAGYRYYRLLGVSGSSTANSWDEEIEFKESAATSANNATGSFTSTVVIPQDGVAKTSMGLVVIYKEHVGDTTPNTHFIGRVRANAGQAYSENTVVFVDKGTFTHSVAGLKIAVAPAIAVTSGSALSYEISFASQSSGSLETRIYGVAMTY